MEAVEALFEFPMRWAGIFLTGLLRTGIEFGEVLPTSDRQ